MGVAVTAWIDDLNKNRTAEGDQPIVGDVDLFVAALNEIVAALPVASVNSQVVSQGRLTLTTGVPVLVADVTGAANIIFTPFVGNQALIWNGTAAVARTFTELTKSVAGLAANSVADVFLWDNAGTVELFLHPWTSATVRATAVDRLTTGYLTNGAAIVGGPATGFGTLLGTIAVNAASQLNMMFTGAPAAGGNSSRLDVCNLYNTVDFEAVNSDTNTGAYKANAFQVKNASAANEIIFVLCEARHICATNIALSNISATTTVDNTGIGLDSAVAQHAACRSSNSQPAGGGHAIGFSQLRTPVAAGRHFVAPLEQGTNGAGNVTWQAAGGAGFQYVTGFSLNLAM